MKKTVKSKALRLCLFWAVLILVIFKNNLSAQNVISFEYDKTGNRTERKITIASKTLSADQIPEIITETVSKRDIKFFSSIQGQVTVEISTLEGMNRGTISIYSFPYGGLVTTRDIRNNREDLDLSNNIAGIYILVVDIDGDRTSHKLMKK